MFKLKYKITDADMKAVNKSVMWLYFIPYLVVSLLGIGAGIAATVLHLRTELLVLGCILIALGAILLVLSVMLLIMPKNFGASALIKSDEFEREFIIDKTGITVKTDNQSDIYISYAEFTKLKNKTTYLIGYLGKEQVIVIKDAITEGGSFAELYDFLNGMIRSAQGSAAADLSDAAKSSAEPAVETESESEPEESADATEEKSHSEISDAATEEPTVTEESAVTKDAAQENSDETAATIEDTSEAEKDGKTETAADSAEVNSAGVNSEEKTDVKEKANAEVPEVKKPTARKKQTAKSGRSGKSGAAEKTSGSAKNGQN